MLAPMCAVARAGVRRGLWTAMKLCHYLVNVLLSLIHVVDIVAVVALLSDTATATE